MQGMYAEIASGIDMFRMKFIVTGTDTRYPISQCRFRISQGGTETKQCYVDLSEISNVIACPNPNDRIFVGYQNNGSGWSSLIIPTSFTDADEGGLLSCLFPNLPYFKGRHRSTLPTYDEIQQLAKDLNTKFVVVQIGNYTRTADFAIIAVDRLTKDFSSSYLDTHLENSCLITFSLQNGTEEAGVVYRTSNTPTVGYRLYDQNC